MNLSKLREFKSKIKSGKDQKFEKIDITDAFQNNKDDTLVELEEISAFISLSNIKTENQIKKLVLATYHLHLKHIVF